MGIRGRFGGDGGWWPVWYTDGIPPFIDGVPIPFIGGMLLL